MVLGKLFFITLLSLILFASEDKRTINATKHSRTDNKTLIIANGIFKQMITEYLTTIDAFHLYCTSQEFYEFYGGKEFGKWLKENQEMLKFFFKPLNLEQEINLPSCDFILKFPPGNLITDEIFDYTNTIHENIVFEFEIVGSVNPYGTKYLKQMPIPKRKRLNGTLLMEEFDEFEIPKLKQRTNSRTPVIMIAMNEKGDFVYKFRNDPISFIPKTGLLFYCKRNEYPHTIEIYDGSRSICFGFVKLELFIVRFFHNFSQIFPKNIHVYIPHSNYLNK